VELYFITVFELRLHDLLIDKVMVLYMFSRYIFPEFLPNPDIVKRDKVSERLERRDMLNRRTVISIPEFYVGE